MKGGSMADPVVVQAVPAEPMRESTPLVQTTTTTVSYQRQSDVHAAVDWTGNVLWILIGGGIIIALAYYLFALVFCVTIVGIPCGLQLYKLGNLALLPFGQQVRGCGAGCEDAGCGFYFLGNVVWLPLGCVLLLLHLLAAIANACSVVGIPFAFMHLKLAQMAICPFGASAEAKDQGGFTTVTSVEHAYMAV